MKRFPYLAHALVCILLVLFDQVSKYFARTELKGNPVPVIDGVFSLHYLENRGTIWGLLQGKVDVLLIVSLLIFALLVYMYIRLPKTKEYLLFSWVLVVIGAGAIGNGIDRMFFGFVTDFLYFELINFPIFNIADCYLTVCEFFLIYLILFGKYKNEEFKFLLPRRKDASEHVTDIADSDEN